MDYQVGSIGRVIVARGFDGEDVYGELEGLLAKENVRSGVVLMVGGLRSAKVVVGPVDPNGPIEPQFRQFDDAREIVGVGTIFSDESGPKMHLHTAIGRGDEAIVGCPRGGANVFCVLEIIVIELTGLDAARELDPQTGLKLLSLVRPDINVG